MEVANGERSPRRQRVQKLHLVGFTTDQKGLILSARRGARSGSFHVTVDQELADAVEELRAKQREAEAELVEETEAARPARVESALSVREIQARLRQGRSVADVAKAAGVDVAWVDRFAAPVLAERAQVIGTVQSSPLRRARLGPSEHPIAESIRRNLADRNVSLTPEEFAEGWTARQLGDGRWAVRFRYRHRGHDSSLRFDVDDATGAISAADRQSGLLAYITPTTPPTPAPPPRPTLPPAPPTSRERGPATRPTVTVGFRPDEAPGHATSRAAKERERANESMRKAAAKAVVDAERAAARRAKEREAERLRREREAEAEEARRARAQAAAERAKAAAARKKAAAAKQRAAERAKAKAAKQAADQARRAEAALRAAERRTAAAKKAATAKAAAKKAAAKPDSETAPAKPAPAKKAPAEKVAAKKDAAKKAAAKTAPAGKAAVKKAPPEKPAVNTVAPVEKAPVKKAAVKKAAGTAAPDEKARAAQGPAENEVRVAAVTPKVRVTATPQRAPDKRVAPDPVEAVRVVPAPEPNRAPAPRPAPAVAPLPDGPTGRRTSGPEPLTPGSSLYFDEDVNGTVRVIGPAARPPAETSPAAPAFRVGTVETTPRVSPAEPRPAAAPPSNGRARERPPGERRMRPLRAT